MSVAMMQKRLLGKFNSYDIGNLSEYGRHVLTELHATIRRNGGFSEEYNPAEDTIEIYQKAGEDNISRIKMIEDHIKELQREIKNMSLQIDEPEIIIDPVALAEAVRVSDLPDTMALRTAITIYLSKVVQNKSTGVYVRHSTVYKSPALLIKCG